MCVSACASAHMRVRELTRERERRRERHTLCVGGRAGVHVCMCGLMCVRYACAFVRECENTYLQESSEICHVIHTHAQS